MNIIKSIKARLIKPNLNKSSIPAFIHVPKTGGSYLGQRETSKDPVLSPIRYLGHTYVVTDDAHKNPIYQVPPYDWDNHVINYSKINKNIIFSTVRNPFSWLVSYAGHSGVWETKYLDTNHYDYKIAQKGFEYLIKTIANREDIWPCRKFLFFQFFDSSGKFILDNLLYNKTLNDDLEEFAKSNGFKYAKKPNQRVGKKVDYREMFSDELVELVSKTWQRELDLYGYSFEGVKAAMISKKVTAEQRKALNYNYITDKLIIKKDNLSAD